MIYLTFKRWLARTNQNMCMMQLIIWRNNIKRYNEHTYHFFNTILSHLVPVCAEISFFKSPTVSSGLNTDSRKILAICLAMSSCMFIKSCTKLCSVRLHNKNELKTPQDRVTDGEMLFYCIKSNISPSIQEFSFQTLVLINQFCHSFFVGWHFC